MAHFAKIENGIVTNVVVVDNTYEANGQEFLNSIGLEGTWVQTSYNNTKRRNYAGVGFTYDKQRDAFIPPQPYASWLLDEDTCRWKAPTPMPEDGKNYVWDEPTTSWIEVL